MNESPLSFGLVQPTLIQQIKKILDQYPDDGQILKELIQNAEDAGAKEVKFLYDHHSYGTEHLHHPGLAKFQGPALYSYNDAEFTEADWKGLGMLCDSIKEKDPTKVGRFGLGFKSVFHMTDLPSVISADSLGIIDPQEIYFGDWDYKSSGKRWNLKRDKEIIQTISDQFAPYKGILDKRFQQGIYKGTLFRLPLRQEASKLTETVYTENKIKGLFECFEKDAHLILLFLIKLERIEVYERDANSLEPRKLFHVRISNSCLPDVRKARNEFRANVEERISALSDGCFTEVKKTYSLTIETVHYHGSEIQGRRLEHSFVVTLFFSGSDVSPEIKALIRDDSLSYLPLVGIALPLEQQVNGECDCGEENVDMNDYHDEKYAHDGEDEYEVMESSGNGHEDKKDPEQYVDLHEPKGHLFCFLPLPLENKSLTGLPVHVNGFFALSQNRRHLKWPSADQDEAIQPLTDKSLLWNKGLLNEVLPKAYAELVLQATSRLPSEAAYGAWPDVHQVNVKWRAILQPLFRILLKSKVLYSDANSGVWCKVDEVLLDDLGRNNQSRKIVTDVLNRAGRRVVTVPVNVKTALQQHYPTIEYVTPRILRKCLKADRSCYVHLSHKDKTLLLRYVLSDSGHYEDLEGLELLPLSDKTFTTFQRGSDPIYIDSCEHPKSLLPRLQKMFVNTEIDTDLTVQLKNAATKGHTQICYFDKEAVKRHLHQTLPTDWLSSEEHVTWYPGISDQPTTGWLKELWLYFGSHFHETAFDLDAFLGLPLVPVSPLNKEEVQLARIQRYSSLIVDSYHGENIDEAVCQVLMALGLPVLFDLPDYVKHYPRLVPAVANSASPRGVLNAIGVFLAKSQNQSDFLQRIRELPADKIRSLRTFLSSISAVTSKEVDLLCNMPVFETFVGCGKRQSRFVSINEVKVAAPVDDIPPVNVVTYLLDLRDHSSRVLAQILGTVPMSRIDLIKTLLDGALASKYSESDVDILVKYTLERFGIFHGEDFQCIKEKLQCLPFVVSSNESRKKTTELFSPEDKLLKQIFMDEDVFPKESYYSRPEVKDHLKKLGLKGQEGIAPSDILKSARKVTGIQDHSIEKAMQKSKGILTYLNKHLHVLNKRNASDESSLHFQLSPIPWIPVVTRKPPTYPTSLPLKESDNGCFARIKDVKSSVFINLVGSVKNLVDIQAIACFQLSDYFNWKEKPAVNEVIMHLGNVISNYYVNEKSFFITIAKEIYEYMANEDSSVITKELQEKGISNWVWNGDGFSSPSEMSIEPPSINLSPYFSSLPPEMEFFSDFFKEYGIKVNFDEEDLVKCLQKIEKSHQKRKQNRGSCERDLTLAITILNKLKPQNGEPFSKDLREKLFIPVDVEDNTRLELAPVMECTYCDPEWERHGYDVSDLYDKDEAIIKLIHRNIPHSTAELLGVPTLLSRFLSAEELQMGESFGQSESLLDRLRGLLEGYTDGLSVPKELIQNADDAGATEVRFLYDERKNEDCMTCLIDEGMKECHGPALWAYNNAVFSDEDFQNIVKLNAATKREDSTKIGRFGLGFNSVYNLTDVPSFLSKSYIVILDPHTTYLGKAIRDKSKPGIKLRMEEKKLRRLANQFKPYNGIFGCEFRPEGQLKPYNGTLFRFPLRTASQASKSDIKKLQYDDKQVRELLRILFHGAESLLLFTQNVLRVTVYHLRNESTESPKPIELFRISKSCSKVIHRLKSELSLSNPVQELAIEDQEFVKQSSILKASSSMMKDRLNGNFISSPGVLMKSSMILKCQCTLTDDGTLYFGLDSERSQASWLVTSCMVSGDALGMSLQNRGLLPTAGVAAKLTEADSGKYAPVPITMSQQCEVPYQSNTSYNGSLFCFLPLPIHSGLPVHINGCFAVSDNRRYLRERTEDDKIDRSAEWNDILLKEVVCHAYVSLLEDLKKLSSSSGYQFHLLWPRCCDVQAHCQGMVAQFYRSLFFGLSSLEDYSRIPELFSDGKRWSSIQTVVFLEPAFSSDERIGQVALDVMKTILESTNKIVVNLPEEIFQSFERYELQSEAQKMCYNKERFFREVFFPAICSVDASSRDKLVLYALDDDSEELRELIRSYRCIPSSPSGHHLKYPAEHFHPSGKAAGLFSPEDERFPYGEEFTCEERLVKLKRLGMRDNDLEWSEVIERAESIKSLAPYHQGLERTKLILTFTERKLLDERQVDKVVQTRLHQIQFFPVMKKPEGFPFKWKGDEYAPNIFLSAAELYPRELKYLAGSSVPILDDSKNGCGPIHSSVKNFLYMNKNASLNQVKVQLKIMIEANQVFHNSENFEELKKAFENVYDHLQSSIKQNSQDVVDFLKPLHFILIEKQLLSCRQVVFSSQVNYPPYLSELPFEYKHRLGELFRAIGVRECFEIRDYIQTLQHVKHKYGENPIGEEVVQVTNVLNSLAEEMLKKCVSATDAVGQHGSIFIPDSKEIMKASKEVCVKDCYWMPNEPGVNYINEKVSPQVCITLGANTRRQETLRKHTFGIPFGQKERLTNRLRRVLTVYPCNDSILKELVQNADDAQASKICFINDPRQHPHERVFEECWKPLQGPALCVYNDAPFTQSDIEGIQNLGEGSKGDDLIKTGQFGVGFNAVYHLTDAPTFISQGEEIGEVMCVFDPNLKFAPGADPSNPGVMYKDLARLREMFTDVFPCYLGEQHFPLNNATMFRFPLRNEDMARTSKISNKAMTTETLDELLKDFKKELLQVLLFVNNVKEISLCETDDETGEMTELYQVRSYLSPEDQKNRTDFAVHVNEIGKRLKHGEMSVADIFVTKVSYILDLEDSKGFKQNWLVVQQIGFENTEVIPDNIDEAFKRGDLGLLPRGGVASLISSSEKHQNLQGKAYCFLPLPCYTGLPVHINGHFALNQDRRSLWRDDKGDYRSNWNDALLRQVIAPCYVTLLDEVRQYICLPRSIDGKTYISGSRHNSECAVLNYFKYFPSFSVQDENWKTLTREVYQFMNARKFHLLPVLREENNEGYQNKKLVFIEWLPPSGHGHEKAYFGSLLDTLPADFDRLDEDMKNKAVEGKNRLRDTLLALGINLLSTPMEIYNHFIEANVDVSRISPRDVIDYLLTYDTSDQLCAIDTLPLPLQQTPFKCISNFIAVFEYCKQDSTFFERIEGLPLLVTHDEVLRVFSQSNKVFVSGYFDLLPDCWSMFVHGKLINCEIKRVQSPVFTMFDIASFARLLPEEINENSYKAAKNRCITWHPDTEENQIPNKEWIHQVWKFFSSFIERVIKKNGAQKTKSIRAHSSVSQNQQKAIEESQQSHYKIVGKGLTQEALSPVMDCCLLPVVESGMKHVLFPVSMADSVIYLERPGFHDLKDALNKLLLPTLNCRVIDGGNSTYSVTARRIVGDLDDPESVLRALLRKVESDCTPFKSLSHNDCISVLRYFDSSSRILQPLVSAEKLRKLPLYVTVDDGIVNISGKQAFVLSSRIPKEDMHIWEETSGIVFLKKNDSLDRLYNFLKCATKDEVDVYCDVIFELFEDMNEDARLKHLTFVYQLVKELDDSFCMYRVEKTGNRREKLAKLRQSLRKLKFMKAKDGSLQTASSFHDPSNQVFKVLFENKQEMFPPEPFRDKEWLSFLREIGLIHKVSNEEFLKFAKEVELEAERGVDDGTRRKSEALVTYLFKCGNIATNQLLDHVKGICFIFPYTVDRGLQNIHAQYGSEETGSPCICFQGSVASCNCSITWTSAKLLPDYANPSRCKRVPKDPKKIAHRLEILYQPTVDMVVTNCKNICHVLNRMNPNESDQRENKMVLLNPDQVVEIMTKTYEYLRTYYDGNEGVINELKNMHCIIVDNGRRLVYPNQIVVEFPSGLSEIPPYLYKIPSQLTTCVDLFEKLGANKTVTPTQYANVLRNLYMESGDIRLDPNQITKAFKAAKGFFETMDKEAHVQSKDIWPLYLPGVKQDPESDSKNLVFLRLSTDILYNDVPHFKERIKQFHDLVLVKLADVGVNVSNEDSLVKKLPESIRPRMLTSVVHETLIEKSQPSSCSSTAQDLRHILTSIEFCHGLIRLIKHADHESDTETASDILTTVSEKLSCIQVHSIPNLQTRLVCNDRTIPGSEEDVSCFEETEDGNQKVLKIYIEKEAELIKYASKVAETVDRITGHLLKTMLVHLPMMLFSKPCEIKDLLDGLKIREDNSVLKIEGTCLPTLGNFIHIADHHLLVDDFTVLSPGEYVGYELDDPSLRGEEGTPTYIYAIIIEEVTEEDQPTSAEPSSRRYRIKTGKDKQPIVTDVADLYTFCHTNPNKVTKNETFGLESTSGPRQNWKENQDRDNRPASLEEARSEIQKVLGNALRLNEEKRQKIIKRLFLKWHPDKNPEKEEFCTEIFKFIKKEVERLEADINLNQPTSENVGGKKYDETLDSCFRRWEKRATSHKEERERNAFSDRDFNSSSRKNPQPAEARRWFKQAVADLNAAKSENEHKPSYEWVSFKCHQSAEKALKAAHYSLDADKINVHDLRILAQNLDNEPLQELACMLEQVIGNSMRMRYPDRIQYPDIPNNVYTDAIAFDALNLAESIVKNVETSYMH